MNIIYNTLTVWDRMNQYELNDFELDDNNLTQIKLSQKHLYF